MWIMVAGPYRAKTKEARQANLRAMNEAALAVFRKGHTPIIGVNLALPIIECGGGFDEVMMPVSLAAARKCEAILRIGGDSQGADEEVSVVESGGGLVFRSIDEVPNVRR